MIDASPKVVQPAGNYYDKYNTRNPIARRLMNGFLAAFESLVERCGDSSSALEVGCGEGELSMRLARRGKAVKGFDIAEEVVIEARRRSQAAGLSIPFYVGSALDLEPEAQAADLVVCCEVLEHLEEPERALRLLAATARKHLLVSVPREPVWRALNLARGRYVTDLGNTPGHIQHWSTRGFVSFLERHVDIVSVATPLPWTMVLCKPRHDR